jgi:hypothetical protein
VVETARTFSGHWYGTGEIDGAGDAERVGLGSGKYMVSEVIDTDVSFVTIEQNVYDEDGDDVTIKYRHGATEVACLNATWNAYVDTFSSLGYVQIRLEATT